MGTLPQKPAIKTISVNSGINYLLESSSVYSEIGRNIFSKNDSAMSKKITVLLPVMLMCFSMQAQVKNPNAGDIPAIDH